MKHLLFLTFLLSSFVAVSRPITISNDSNCPIEVILWKDSKIIFHHVMNPNDEITVEDIGYGLLCQFKPVAIISYGGDFKYCGHAKVISDLWIEVNLDTNHFTEHERWFSKITMFGIAMNIMTEQPRA